MTVVSNYTHCVWVVLLLPKTVTAGSLKKELLPGKFVCGSLSGLEEERGEGEWEFAGDYWH